MSKEEKSENKNYKILNKKEENKILSLEVELPFEQLEVKKDSAVKELGKHVEVKGFRKGAAPANVVTQEVGPMKVLEEMAYQAVVEILPTIIADEKFNPLTQPKISVTKIAENNPMTFKADFVLMPDVNIGDYKKIAAEVKQIEEVKVEDKEIDEYIDYIRNSKAEAEALAKKTSTDEKEREEANKEDAKVELPELNDEFVKTLGDFKNVEDFKNQLRENMKKDKEGKELQKRRIEIIEKIIEGSEIEIPELMIEEELERMLLQFKGDIEMAKMNFEDYIKSINKTEEELQKEWRPDAIKRTKMNLILPKIAIEEKIEADPEKVAHEVKHLKQHYPDVSDEQATAYVSNTMRNENVFKFLEELK